MAQAETSNIAYQIQNLINKHLMSLQHIVVTVAQIEEVTTASLLI